MDLKELNHAGEHAVFGSIKVLGDIDGKGMRTIRRDVDLIQNTQYKFKQRVDNYWSSLSDDGIITPVEKIALHKEWESIVQSHAALYEQAQEKQLTEMPYWQDYEDAYDALKKMLFTDEGIFDLMEDNTELINVDNFNNKFSEYYYAEKFIQLALATGIIDKLGLRTLTSLDDPGADGDLAFYRGELYQHVNGVWVKVGTEDYLGTLSSLQPALWSATQGQYFLASSDFVITEAFYVNGEPFFVNDEPFYVGHIETEYAKIYYYDGKWKKAQDSDPRYIAILVDYMALTGELPESLTNRIIEIISDNVFMPEYYGVLDIAPVNPHEGDWFYYVGVTTGDTKYDWIKGRIHIYKGNSWENIAADDDTASQYYMRALQDILTYEKIDENGYFSNIFCNAFFTNKASINALKVKTIYLYYTGALQSENTQYSAGSVGLRIDASGNIDANGTAHFKGPCAIGMQLSELGNYNIGIGGNAKIDGNIIARTFQTPNYSSSQRTGVNIQYENTGYDTYPLSASLIRTRQISGWGQAVYMKSLQLAGAIATSGRDITTKDAFISFVIDHKLEFLYIPCIGYLNASISIWRIAYFPDDLGGEPYIHYVNSVGTRDRKKYSEINSISIFI